MRLALTGSHKTGKTTLARHLARANNRLSAVEEPYYGLQRQGYPFSPRLSRADLEVQLEFSLASLKGPRSWVVFDRCPLDFLGYLACHSDAADVAWDQWVPRVLEGLDSLDLLVRVPIESPDRITLDPGEVGAREAVDRALTTLLDTEVFRDLRPKVFTVTGALDERVRTVLGLLP